MFARVECSWILVLTFTATLSSKGSRQATGFDHNPLLASFRLHGKGSRMGRPSKLSPQHAADSQENPVAFCGDRDTIPTSTARPSAAADAE